ncbi:MAG: RNA polymerase sigma factor [Coriobacteriia bacterium]|nr:RNA polymerase sigma factor [Coriobacteriia bacterium]
MVTRAMSDPGLVAAVATGDEQAFASLVRLHSDAVYGHAFRFFGDRQTAEDATQEVFVKVFRTITTFDGRAKFSTWLYRVTRNVCLDMARAGKRVPQPVDPVSLEPLSTADFADDVVLAEAIERAMRALAPEDRDALGAVTLFGLSYAEAAETLGIPVGTVKSRVFRARRLLTAVLQDAEGGVGNGLPASS